MGNQVIFGTTVADNDPPYVGNPAVVFPGQTLRAGTGFQVDEDILSKHILLLGGSGCGKTNTFFFVLRALREKMGNDDIAIVFDTKGEFYEKFSRPGDIVIGNSAQFRQVSYTWNIFDDVLADGETDACAAMNAREIAAALFHGRGSSTQPFFCNAARDIFAGILLHFIRQARADPEGFGKYLNNKDLTQAFRQFRVEQYMRIFQHYPDTRYMLSYFGDGKSNQALGVFGELNNMLAEYFVGVLADHNPDRSLSMRRAVREKGGRAVFVEYDLSLGEVLAPMYRLLVDQALKEALGRVKRAGHGRPGRVYLVADEFKLLPKLQHIDDALNFGRGQGVRVIAGIQSIDQLYDIYGQDKGAVIASGFGSIFAFYTNDWSSRDYIARRFGTNVVAYDYINKLRNDVISRERDGNTVEQWDQLKLGIGEAVIGLGRVPPFLFKFAEYKG